MSRHAALVLAAGGATRMGQPKQLLRFRGKTLVENAASQALAAGFDPVIVVTGAEADAVRNAVAGTSVLAVENRSWQTGMGSSITVGLQALPRCDAVAILLADQPLVSAAHLRAMRKLLTDGDLAVAARYGGTLGVPALFGSGLFERLTALQPDEGARGILRDRSLEVLAFDLPEAAADIDTPSDFASLLEEQRS